MKELLPIVMGVAIWGWQWSGKVVKVQCDNAAVVHTLRTGSCKNDQAMHLLRSLFFWQARTQLSLETVHIPGRENGPADSLSCNDAASFISKVPYAQETPVAIPPAVEELLMKQNPDWTSQTWTALWGDTLRKA